MDDPVQKSCWFIFSNEKKDFADILCTTSFLELLLLNMHGIENNSFRTSDISSGQITSTERSLMKRL